MNRMTFGEGGCEQARKFLDSYVSNELLVETSHDVLRHLERCPACAAEAEARAQLRSRLKSSVRAQEVPPELRVRVRERLRREESRGWFAQARWPIAIAATAALSVAVWIGIPPERLPALADRPAQNAYIQKVSARIAAVLQVGLRDHIHCAVFRKFGTAPAPAVMESELGPSFRGLLPVVEASVPKGYRVIMAHQCSYLGRKYVHLTAAKDGSLISVVIARKQEGESFTNLLPATERGGVAIFESATARYQVAGFDAGNFLAYVVSDLRSNANLEVATAIAPGVRAALAQS